MNEITFGKLLKQTCRDAGITVPLLEKLGKDEHTQLSKRGLIAPGDTANPVTQNVISRVIEGRTPPTAIQTYIWVAVIKRHYSGFTPELENALWALSGHHQY